MISFHQRFLSTFYVPDSPVPDQIFASIFLRSAYSLNKVAITAPYEISTSSYDRRIREQQAPVQEVQF